MTDRGESAGTLISVVIPVFNGERFLSEAIESVLAQDHRTLEVIVVDDGSTDGSAAIADAFEDVIAIRIEHAGPAAARNAGLARAGGDLVAFLDADDTMTDGRLSSQLAYFERHPDVGCLLTRQEPLTELGAPPLAGRAGASGTGAPSVSSMVVRRDALVRVGGLDPSYGWTEWMDLLIRLREAGVRIEELAEVGMLRRVHAENRSRLTDAVRDGLAKAVREHLSRSRSGLSA